MKNPVVTLTKWLNDVEGSSFGDERERLRYYEAHSACLNLQFLMTPTIGAILILAFSKSATVPILILSLFPIYLSVFALIYLKIEKVAIVKNSEKNPKWMMISVLAFIPLEIALCVKFAPKGQDLVSFWIGAASALILLFLALGFFTKKKVQN